MKAVGLRPQGEGRCVVDPMPFGLDGFEAKGLPMQGASLEVAREGDYQERGATGAGGRVFSAPAPFIPSTPSPGSTPYSAPSVGLPATAPPPTASRNVPSVPRGTMGTGTTRY